jgi:hypothetical protein
MRHVDAPTIFRLSGFNSDKAQWISGLNNIFYMVCRSYYHWITIAQDRTNG